MLEIEKFIPKENFYVGLLFDEGYFLFKILRRQQLTVKMPYDFDDGDIVAPMVTTGWETPTDAQGRFFIEPQEEETIIQTFIGISPSQSKLYLQYTQREDRMNLIVPRVVPGNVGFWDGEVSPYHDPSPCTELWTVHDLVPYFNMENPGISGTKCHGDIDGLVLRTSFWINIFTYEVVQGRTDAGKQRILQFLRGERRCTVRTMGDGHRPIKAPAWLIEDYRKDMVQAEEV